MNAIGDFEYGRHVVGGAPAVAVSEQPRRELSSAHPTTRTGDETLQIVAACDQGFRHQPSILGRHSGSLQDRNSVRDDVLGLESRTAFGRARGGSVVVIGRGLLIWPPRRR